MSSQYLLVIKDDWSHYVEFCLSIQQEAGYERWRLRQRPKRQQKVVVCSNGEANGEVIAVEFKEWLFELNPACLRRSEDSIQNGGMNFVESRDTYEGGLFW